VNKRYTSITSSHNWILLDGKMSLVFKNNNNCSATLASFTNMFLTRKDHHITTWCMSQSTQPYIFPRNATIQKLHQPQNPTHIVVVLFYLLSLPQHNFWTIKCIAVNWLWIQMKWCFVLFLSKLYCSRYILLFSISRYLMRQFISHLSQSPIRPSIYFSSIVKSR